MNALDKMREVKKAISEIKIFEVVFDDYDIAELDVTEVGAITPRNIDYWDIFGSVVDNDGVVVNVDKFGDATVLIVANTEREAIRNAKEAMLDKLT